MWKENICVDVYMGACICIACARAWRSEVSHVCSPVIFHLLFRDQVSLWTWSSPMRPGWLAGQRALGILLSPSQHWDYRCVHNHTWIFMNAGDPNSGLRDYTASALPAEPSSQPPVHYLSEFHDASLSFTFNSHVVPLISLKWSPATDVTGSLSCPGLFSSVSAPLFWVDFLNQ